MITPAKEYWETWTGGIYTPEEIMVAFATFHVKAALLAAASNATTHTKTYNSRDMLEWDTVVDKQSILDAYPLENIT